MAATAASAAPPQTFPYDYLFKVLIIGDASVGKVREWWLSVLMYCTGWRWTSLD